MNAAEWEELRSMAEESFWVTRVIGMCNPRKLQTASMNQAHSAMPQDILHYLQGQKA